MTRAAHEHALAERLADWAVEIRAADARVTQAESELAELKAEVGKAIGLQIGRPTPEALPGGVVIDVHLSAFVLRELAKRMDELLLVKIVVGETARRLEELLQGFDYAPYR
jgi:tetrahydromethanopterin S-methyltransferase subunit G